MQVRAALSKGQFTVDKELNAYYRELRQALNPPYKVPTKTDINDIVDALHEERLEQQKKTTKSSLRDSVFGPVLSGERRRQW